MTLEMVTDTKQVIATAEPDTEILKAMALTELRKLGKVVVFSKPSCVQCTATYRDLAAKGIEHEVFDLSEREDLLTLVKQAGHLGAPVIVTDEDHWSGFRPDKIDEIARRAA